MKAEDFAISSHP